MMATFTWEVYANTPGWFGIGANTIVFSGDSTDLSVPITVGNYNAGTHLGSGDPGSDQCGTTHMPNVEYVAATTFKLNGGSTENLNDTNLTATECGLRIRFTDASSVATSNARFYSFDGTTETAEAVGIEAYAFEQGVTASTWVQINDDSGNIGGDNSGERLALSDQSANTEHTYYVAVSARPESVGSKTQFDLGIALTYS
jgi:hypothetical protein